VCSVLELRSVSRILDFTGLKRVRLPDCENLDAVLELGIILESLKNDNTYNRLR
jgi:hypothetical protein